MPSSPQPETRAERPPAAPARGAPAEPVAPPAAGESDEAAIRAVIRAYERAIESKSLEQFRAVRPGITAAEEARLRESFRQIQSQEVEITIDDLRIDGRSATFSLSRRDTIVSGGRRQTESRQQTLRLAKTATGWIIVQLGR